MHLKFLRVAGSVALCGGIAAPVLVPTQAALATPNPTYLNVPCLTSALVAEMNAPADNTVLNLAPGCTYWLSTTGLPTVMHELTINGHGDWIKRSYAVGTPSFSIFVVGYATGNLILKDVNVAHGGGSSTAAGGAIDITNAWAHVSVHDGTFRGNTATFGGAISNDGTLTVDGATFTDNSAEYGGAVWSGGSCWSATLNHDTFSHNYASEDGGAIGSDDNDMTVTDSLFAENRASGEGGAVYNEYDMTITHSQFGMNSATRGGALYNDDNLELDLSLVANNLAKDGGGGIYNNDGTPTLVADLINLNVPDQCEPVGTIAGCAG